MLLFSSVCRGMLLVKYWLLAKVCGFFQRVNTIKIMIQWCKMISLTKTLGLLYFKKKQLLSFSFYTHITPRIFKYEYGSFRYYIDLRS